MTIKKMFMLANGITYLAIIGLGIAAILLINTQKDLNESQDIRYKSYQVAKELRQNSDDLTRLVRTYVVTGDEKYARQYFELVDIANGLKPRKDGRTVSFKQMMKELNFAQEEFDKIQESETKSNELVATEERAINAVKGLSQDAGGKYTVQGQPDLELARKLVFDESYHKFVETINKPIEEFFVLLEKRTSGTVDTYVSRSYFYLYIIFGMIITLVIIQVVSNIIINKKVVSPIKIIQEATLKASQGDLSVKVEHNTNDEIGQLSAGFNGMVENIKRGIDELADEKAGIQKKVDYAVKESEEQKIYLSRNVEVLLKEMD
ncbi:MAG: HAMP domain-containing protein, partial [Syntrophothermus sp.]